MSWISIGFSFMLDSKDLALPSDTTRGAHVRRTVHAGSQQLTRAHGMKLSKLETGLEEMSLTNLEGLRPLS